MIRKITGLLFLLCLSPLALKAQEPFKTELAAGGSFGMAFNTVSFSPKVQENTLMTITAGATLRWITQKNCGLQAELNYIQQGWDELFDDPGYHYTRRINYIELPVMSHFYVGKKAVRFIFNVGPQIGYSFGDTVSENLNGQAPDPNRQTDQRTKEIEKKFGWGLCGGPGMEIRTGIGNFILEGRYYYSLGDIFNNSKTDTFAKSSPQVISVKLTYLIPLLKNKN